MATKSKVIKTKQEPIAIVGMGCRFPGGAQSPSEFWDKVLTKGKDAVTTIPSDRWDAEAYYNPDYTIPGKISIKWGGFVDDIDKFDAQFFGVSPREAIRMDPQQRLLLEASYHAMEDAGLDVNALAGENVGVFVGISAHDYGDIGMHPTEHVHINGHTISGGSLSIASNRISYLFDFRGPSFSVDTACSSSMIALHNACRSILNNECPIALVGGANALIKPEITMSFSKGGFLSPDGRSFAFDKRANGYIRSEGFGVVVLKPLSQAIADGDRIYTTIIGSAINQDGATDGMSMPSEEAQVAVLEEAYKRAGVDPAKIQYVEAHGTGTAVGDPIEASSIGRVVGTKKSKGDKVYIGSVKSNIGHCEPASGMAGLIKLALSMNKKQLPKNANFKTPNPKIKFGEYNLEVPTNLMDWPAKKGETLYAGINSFGFGGANAHAVLMGYEGVETKKTAAKKDSADVFMLSARSQGALQALAESYVKYLKSTDASFADICYTLKTRKSHHDFRLTFVASSKDDAIKYLKVFLKDETRPGMNYGRISLPRDEESKVAFVYSGQGPQWWGMGRELMKNEPLFKSAVEKIDSILQKLGWLKKENSSLLKELSKPEKSSRMDETEIAQPAIFAIQVGLTEMWRAMGVKPDAIVGHSIGECAAAYASGALSLEEATRIIYHRSKSQSVAAGKGKMLAVGLSEGDARDEIAGYEDLVAVAVINGPKMLTLSGDEEALEKIAKNLSDKDIFHRFLRVDVPFHSHYLDAIKTDFTKSVGTVKTSKTETTLYSTVTGSEISGASLNAKYWFNNIRQPVLFYPAIKEMMNEGYNVFVEIAPHPILSSSISDTFDEAGKKGVTVASLRRKEEEKLMLLGSLGALHAAGLNINWKEVSEGEFVETPLYPFTKERFWLESEESYKQRMGRKIHPHIKRKVASARSKHDHIYDIDLDSRTYPYIADHRVQGPIIYPGAGSCELAFACGRDAFGEGFGFIEDIYFKKAVFLPDEGEPPQLQFNISAEDGGFGFYTRKNEEEAWSRCIHGKLRHLGEEFALEKIPMEVAQKRCDTLIDMEELYSELYGAGLLLGPTFRAVKKCWRYTGGPYIGESFGELHVPEGIEHGVEQFNIHPAILDACFQTLFGSVPLKGDEKLGFCIPVHIKRLKFYRQPTKKLYCYGRLQERSLWYITGELRVYDEDGNLCVDIEGFRCRFIEGTRGEDEKDVDNCMYEYDWKVTEREEDALIREPKKYLPDPVSIKAYSDTVIKEIQDRPEREIYDNEFDAKMNVLTAAYIEQSLVKLGFKFKPGFEFTTDSLVKKYKVPSGYIPKLFNYTLSILASKGVLKSIGDKTWQVVSVPEDIDCEKLSEEMRSNPRYELLQHELLMLNKCGPYLAEVFTGKVDPVELLFPDSEWENTIKFYQESYSFKKYNEIVQANLAKILESLPEGQTLRILEVGAGTGGMTNAILPILPAERTSYYFTDLSFMFMVKAQERFASKYPFLEFKTLDIGKDLEEQGVKPNSFDIVVASDVLHATPSIQETLTNVTKLLAPNGILVMLEVTQCPWWTDLVFGLTEGWWMFNDYDLRPTHPTMSYDKWIKTLEGFGFHDLLALTEAVNPKVSAQTVFIARGKDFKQEKPALTLPEFTSEREGKWLVFADNKGVGEKIVSKIKGLGDECVVVKHGSSFAKTADEYTIDGASQKDMDKLFDEIAPIPANIKGLLHFWNIDCTPTDETSMDSLERDYIIGDTSILNMLRSMFRDTVDEAPHFWIVTAGAMNIGDMKSLNITQSSVWGLARTLMHEYQHLDTTVIDISGEMKEVDSLMKEICLSQQAEEVALRGNSRYLHRLLRLTKEEVHTSAMRKSSDIEGAYHLATKEQGILDNLYYQEFTPSALEDDEVEIKVMASGLNFKDVMIAMGMLHEDAPKGGFTGRGFGMELSGVVSAVGKGVVALKVGDEVLAVAPNTFASHTKTKAIYAVKKPANMSFEDAASIPFAYLTAYYSLNYVGRMEKSDRVLIHAASGGVGLAGVKLAQHMGAEVFATAGSPSKREFLKSLGVKYVYDSRSLSFAEEIMKDTNGEGVDLVLNSLSGDAIFKSMSVLRKYGRFVEIGKTDIYENSKINLRPFWNNLTYSAVDVDKVLTERPALSARMLSEFMTYFDGNAPEAHPYEAFKANEVIDAFRHMAAARHIGKVVVTMTDEVMVSPSDDLSTALKEDGTYIVVGGFSGLGLTCGQYLAKNGAKNLVLMSRSGAKTKEAKDAMAKLKEAGVNVMEAKVDAADAEGMKKTFDEIKSNMPPIRGIINSAMVLDDAILPDMTHDRFMTAIRPKVMGAWNLHVNTIKEPVDFLISFSSIAAQYGTPAQSNYAAANLYLDMFSYYRRANNLAANTISWGVISEVGFVARSEKVEGILSSQGWRSFNPAQAMEVLSKTIMQNAVHRSAMDVVWSEVANYFSGDRTSHRFQHLLADDSDGGAGASDSLRDSLLGLDSTTRESTLREHVAETIARILGTSVDKLDMQGPISNMGLDSLMANQLRNWIQNKLDVEFSMMKIMRGPSIIELTQQLLSELGEGSGVETASEDNSSEQDKWIVRRKVNDKAKVRLFCLPYMAGGASTFAGWSDGLSSDIEVCAIQYPGREERGSEAAYDNVEKLVAKLAEVMLPMLDKPFALYGHSIGAGVGFKLAHYLIKKGKAPVCFFVGGWIAPHLKSPFKLIADLPEKAIRDDSGLPTIYEHLRNLEIPESVLSNDKLMKEMLPGIKADIILGKNYKYSEKTPLKCPIVAFAGEKDSVFTIEQVEAWKKQTASEFDFNVVKGGHIFLRESRKTLLSKISETLKKLTK